MDLKKSLCLWAHAGLLWDQEKMWLRDTFFIEDPTDVLCTGDVRMGAAG